ncbi:DUF3501 family protein [Aquidulcibacter sp.]|jgi:hypothetical protein|uniref:DUF3501 family protein n=1 Tax=Aquidulcibacter sp. TaxID=2052990 RepID=UPI00078E5BD6|nr:hypothetical protein AEM38_07280 [Hyphomonadaceae bacterium UKL13-1]OYU52997.1 MAG: hypothetical protein CFE27_02840 [Alphaproteobacteria bacterium PA1]HCP65568.1 DUF3501 domain-containing protein [Hyphomonadaceae bacterium]
MPASSRTITRSDLIPDAEFSLVRKARRAELLPIKKLRRIDLGPVCTVYFETFETMLFQIQEMLLIEKGGEEQIQDELAAYNPLIPKGSELVATIMFEIDEPVRRANILARLGGIEEHFFLQIGTEKVRAVPEGDVERTRSDGKASSVHFMHFPLEPAHIAVFREPTTQIMVGSDHESYAHLTILSPATRAELARDFA